MTKAQMMENEIKAICESGIEFKTNGKGQKTAWYYSFTAGRKFRVKLDLAEMLVATGKAEQVKFCY